VYTASAPYSPSHSLSPPSPPCHCTTSSSGRTCFALLFSEFVNKKKETRVSLWHFHVYMCYDLIWFISSLFLLSTLVPFCGGFNRFKNSFYIL
jgi:hypothetical protein